MKRKNFKLIAIICITACGVMGMLYACRANFNRELIKVAKILGGSNKRTDSGDTYTGDFER